MTKAPSPTLPGRLLDLAEARPNDIAIREKTLGIWHEFSWAHYARHTAACARRLNELGITTGDHVAILSENRSEWLFADLGAQSLGARGVGIYQTNPPDDVAYVLSHSRAKVLFCEDQEQADKAILVREQTPDLEHIIVFDPRGLRHTRDQRVVHWDSFIADGLAMHDAEPSWFEKKVASLNPHDAAMVVYTSGTTGQPKGALLSAANALSLGEKMNTILSMSEEDSVLSYLPLCHVAEKIFTYFIPLSVGGKVHFGESIDTVRSDLCEVSPSIFLGVPRIWEKMHSGIILKMKDSSWLKRVLFNFFSHRGQIIADRRRKGVVRLLDSLIWSMGDLLVYRPLQERLGLRRCKLPFTGAAPVSDDLLRWFHGLGIPILEAFGQTESAGVITANQPTANRIGSVGKALPDVEIEIAEDGEILARGPNIFIGYLHNASATAETISEDGWLRTGDVGQLDEDGYLFITGRKKQIIITAGGKNLSPEKIENALKMSPFVKEAIAIGDRRKFISALIQIDGEAAGDWAMRKGIPYTSFEDLSQKQEIRDLIKAEVHQANERLAKVENVRAFRLLPKELHQDDGEMTATQKVRRDPIKARYSNLIDEMYGSTRG